LVVVAVAHMSHSSQHLVVLVEAGRVFPMLLLGHLVQQGRVTLVVTANLGVVVLAVVVAQAL
jgi:hypothetical protein